MSEGQLPLRLRVAWAIRARSKRALLLLGGGALCLSALAATTKLVVDLMRWRDAGSVARAVAGDVRELEARRVDAIVVMQRDVRASIALLRDIEAAGGATAVHARNALDSIDVALGR